MVLVACEESQAITLAFRKIGCIAYSCDLQDCSGGHPEWHIKGDVIPLLDYDWNLIIAHPPCTYLSNVGSHILFKDHNLNIERYNLGLSAKDFFMKFYDNHNKHICIENPVPNKIFNLPGYQQIIQPYNFGEPFSKRTCLWLKGLPPLMNTCFCYQYKSYVYSCHGSKKRSKTFTGIASAMAQQWRYYA